MKRTAIAIYVPCIVALALFLTPTLVAHAQSHRNPGGSPPTPPEDRVALVIGNSVYSDVPLRNPANDATDIAKALQESGFKVILRLNASQRDMRQAIREFGSSLRRAHAGVFYFAGHGVQLRGNNYLVPVGADIQGEADAEDFAIDANYVLRTMEESQVKVSIMILDACRNNPFARSFRSAATGLAQMNAAAGSLIAFATAPGSVAADGSGRNGLYTQYLLESLRQPDTDALRVFQRVRASVARETGGKQIPWESTSLVGDFYFRPFVAGAQVSSPAPAVGGQAIDPATIELAFWDSIKNSANRADFEEYLRQYPHGRFAGLAQNRIKAASATERSAVPNISGTWHWSVRSIFVPDSINTIRPDGSCSVNNGSNCTWKLQTGEDRRIHIYFDSNWTHRMVLSEDGLLMTGTDDWGTRVTARKIIKPDRNK